MAGTGDTSPDTSVRDATARIASLFDANMMIAPEAQTPDAQADGDDGKDQDTPEADRDPTPDEPVDTPKEDSDAPDHTDDEPAGKRKLKLPDGAEVDEDEAVKGYLRQSDYTRKTQALAEEKKKIESDLRPRLEQTADYLKKLETAIKEMTPAEPNWAEERKTLDPAQFAVLVADWNLHERRMAALAKERETAEAAVQAERQKDQAAEAEQAYGRLLELIPEWKDNKVGVAERQEILAYVEPYGMTAEHLKQVQKPEFFVMLRDAARYRKLLAQVQGKPPAAGKTVDEPVLRPGSANTQRPRAQSEVQKAVQRAAKSGSVEDAGAAIRRMGLVD